MTTTGDAREMAETLDEHWPAAAECLRAIARQLDTARAALEWIRDESPEDFDACYNRADETLAELPPKPGGVFG